jgi:putative transposase
MDRDFLRELIRTTLQEVLEAEMTDALGGGQERTHHGPPRLSFGLLRAQLNHPGGQAGTTHTAGSHGQFSTELFELYQRSERALVAALAEMYVKGVSTRKVRALPKSYAGIAFRHPPSAR